jgi:hypothetical protein
MGRKDGWLSVLFICSDSNDPPPLKEFEELKFFCEAENLHLVMGCNSSAHHSVWGSTNCNDRGVALV